MATQQSSQSKAQPDESRPVTKTQPEALLDLGDLTEPAWPVAPPAAAADVLADRARVAAQATASAASDLARVRDQLAIYPSEPRTVPAAEVESASSSATVATEPVGSGAAAETILDAPPLVTPDERDARADTEMKRRGLTRENVTLDQMIDLVRQSIYPAATSEPAAQEVGAKPIADAVAGRSDDRSGSLEASAPSIESGIVDRQPDADQPGGPDAPPPVVEQPTTTAPSPTSDTDSPVAAETSS